MELGFETLDYCQVANNAFLKRNILKGVMSLLIPMKTRNFVTSEYHLATQK